MSYIIIAVIAHIFNGAANIIDKVVVSKYLKSASVYAFYLGALGGLSIFLLPFLGSWLSIGLFLNAFVGGFTFVAAFYLMNAALMAGDTTKVITIIGGTLPVSSFILAWIFLGERLTAAEFIAFGLLVAGIILMSYQRTAQGVKVGPKYARRAIISGILYAISFVTAKYLYSNTTFVNGFIWRGFGSLAAGLAILFVPLWRSQIVADLKSPKAEQQKGKLLILINQTIGAVGFVLLSYSISLGSVTIVNAMQGVQYGFIFLATVLLGKKVPQLRESLSRKIVIQKLLAIGLIIIGLAILAIYQ